MSRMPVWALVLASVCALAVRPGVASAQRARVVTVTITPVDVQVAVGQNQIFLADAFDRGNNPVASAMFTFSSSNVNVATVDANGMATGVGAGTVIITVRAGTGAAAKAATATLTVVSSAPAGVAAHAAPAAALPATAAPAALCSSASTGALNPNRICYDQRPVPRAPLIVATTESCSGPVTPTVVFVHVSERGEVTDVHPVRGSSNCAAFAAAASVYLRNLAFVPAQLRGTAVAAWISFLVRPAPPELRGALSRPTGLGYAAYDRQPDGSGPAVGLVVRPLRVVLERGELRQLEYSTMREDGQNAERVPIVFSVVPGGERLVTVDSVGLIRAVGDAGRAVVRVEVPNNALILPKLISVEVRADSARLAPVPAPRPPE